MYATMKEEKIARAICQSEGKYPDTWDFATNEPYWYAYVKEARRFIAALQAALHD